MKKREREAAALLYIEGQKTLDEIAAQLPVSRRSLVDWKNKGKWEELRLEFVKRRETNADLCLQTIQGLEKEIAADRKAGRKPSTSRLYALSSFQKRLVELRKEGKRELDETLEAPEPEKLAPLSPENFLKIEREEFGLYA